MQIYYDSKTKVVNKDASIEQNFIEEESKNNNNNAYELKRFDTDDNEENSLSKSENGNDNLINKIKGGVHTCECPPLHYPPSIASPLLYFPYSNHEIKLLNEDNDYLFVEDVCKKIRRICLEDTMFEKQDYLLKNVRNNLEFDMSNINDAMNINTNNGAAATHNEDLHTNYNISRNYSGSKKKDTKFVKLPSILPSTTSMSFEGENKEYNEQINDNSNKSIKSNSLCTPSLLSSLSLCLSLSTVTGGSFWRSSSYCNYLNGSREKMNLRLPYIPFGNNNSSNITDSIYNSNNNNILGRVYVHSELSCSSSPSPLNNEITKEQFSNNNNSSNANTATNKKNVPVEENNNNVLCTEDGYVIIPLQCSWITAIMNVLADELLQNFSFKIKTKSTPHITLAAERNKEAQSIISKFYEPLSDFIPQNEWDIVVYEQVKKSSDFETEGPHTFKEIKRIQKIAIS